MAKENSANNDNDNDVEAISLANAWSGRRVIISGVGGAICIMNANQKNSQKTTNNNKHKKTSASAEKVVKTKHGKGTVLVIECSPPPPSQQQQTSSETTTTATIPPGAVAFRVAGTQQYLTMMIYGDQLRQDTSNALASIPSLLPDHIPGIVDYAVDRPTQDGNFEGAGFNYSPMTLQKGPPNKLQFFTLEKRRNGCHSLGVKSLFGSYWRSQHWDKIVSQSPHLLGDETWWFADQDAINRLSSDW
mmetsp:Transcript_8801/g.12467  ORF Transcript_8801/g.12467 Transcript_8801/m.12467 type:complete len:246 (+) Transcript_8801:178-915(+)